MLEMLETALKSVSVEEMPAKTEAKLGKRKRMLDEIVMIDSSVKKVKVTPQGKNLQQKIKKNNTTRIQERIYKRKKKIPPQSQL